MAKKIELAKVLGLVREQLWEANDAAMKNGKPVMQFEECEVEFAVDIVEELKVGFKMYFVALGGKQKKSEANTVRIKFKALDKQGVVAMTGVDCPAAHVERQTKPTK